MQIKLSGIFVNDQAQALAFYTDTLGFVKKNDIDLGEYRWLTVSEAKAEDLELLLEPNAASCAGFSEGNLYRWYTGNYALYRGHKTGLSESCR